MGKLVELRSTINTDIATGGDYATSSVLIEDLKSNSNGTVVVISNSNQSTFKFKNVFDIRTQMKQILPEKCKNYFSLSCDKGLDEERLWSLACSNR
jgi:hypothetical protein